MIKMNRQITKWAIRICDITFSFVALILFLPLFIPITIILKFSGEGKVFFFQERVGYKRKTFCLIKFVTMLEDSPNIGSGELTLPDDPRVLPFGYLLRKTKVNELPQLLNVLIGDLSLIGPRPQTKYYFNCFLSEDVKYISSVKPGLSGIGSIFFRNEEALFRNQPDPKHFDEKIIMPFKGRLERWYAENLSIDKYFILILLTIYVILKNQDVDFYKIFQNLPPAPKEAFKKLTLIEGDT